MPELVRDRYALLGQPFERGAEQILLRSNVGTDIVAHLRLTDPEILTHLPARPSRAGEEESPDRADRARRPVGVHDGDVDDDDVRALWGLLMLPGHMPELVPERPAWIARAACKGEPIETFFPARGATVARAHALCDGCEVRGDCLDYALEDDDLVGWWGGTSAVQRRQLRRRAS